jgi:hypothetical protein
LNQPLFVVNEPAPSVDTTPQVVELPVIDTTPEPIPEPVYSIKDTVVKTQTIAKQIDLKFPLNSDVPLNDELTTSSMNWHRC